MANSDRRDDEGGERIAKAMARAGVASRREAEDWIAAGRVAVNGAVITSPALNVGPGDRISIDGEPLPARERTRMFLYHKPRGLLTSHADPRGRQTIFQNLPKGLPRLISVGRLDFNTEGLLLLTNDGELARVLELPATGWLRRYRVRAHGSIMQPKLDALRGGVIIDGIRYGAIEATVDRVQGSNTWLTFAIREGKNREVRNVLGHLGLTVTRLIRVSFGPFQLGEVAEGAVEEVPTRVLREQLGERVVAQSNADFSAPIIARPQPAEDEAPRKDRRQRPAGPRDGRDEARPSRRDDRPGRQDARPSKHGDRPSGRDDRPSRHGDRPGRHGDRLSKQNDRPNEQSGRPTKQKDRKSPQRKSLAHSWRAAGEERGGKTLRRKFRGDRRDDEQHEGKPSEAGEHRVARSADELRERRAAEKPRAGLVSDRKGRQVLVERYGQPAPVEPKKPQERKFTPRGRRRSPDRASGPRPRSPRGK
jgi:23S rRNA pseudouridine2605 synthase